MGGAAGDALGYEVEFMCRQAILSRYGENGITKFELGADGKALISDDTQMTLFTANGLLMGLTRGVMRGVGGRPEYYVPFAYRDWYYTQVYDRETDNECVYTWLRYLPGMAYRRAPGRTCMNACVDIIRGANVVNNSKGCGGIMRVAPISLLNASFDLREKYVYSIEELAIAACEIAECTHKHPLGFLPAALLAVLIYKVLPLNLNEVKQDIEHIVAETLDVLDVIYEGKYDDDKRVLRELSELAVKLAHHDISDVDAISLLGEGWVAEETWAIALFCVVRHIESFENAVITSVNHDGDSDSTGSVCGNIMGAIYGYEYMKERNLFCTKDRELENTLELSEITLALADDLTTGCIINSYEPLDTPEKKQWYERYCMMKPSGIGER